jgi:hypothetical protein
MGLFNRKVRKGLRKGRKVLFCVGFGHGFDGWNGLTLIF